MEKSQTETTDVERSLTDMTLKVPEGSSRDQPIILVNDDSNFVKDKEPQVSPQEKVERVKRGTTAMKH